MHEVEDVATAPPKVFSSATVVFFSATSQFQKPANSTVIDEPLDDLNDRAISCLMRDCELDVFLFASLHDFISFF